MTDEFETFYLKTSANLIKSAQNAQESSSKKKKRGRKSTYPVTDELKRKIARELKLLTNEDLKKVIYAAFEADFPFQQR